MATIYVDQQATGAGSGSSWTDAYTDLQPALADARAKRQEAENNGDTPPQSEIWVAEGVYAPTSIAAKSPELRTVADLFALDAARKISFELVAGVGIYGGFNGTETARDQRDWHHNVTVLTGHINTEEDLNEDAQLTNNSYHVVSARNIGTEAVLDGFTIVGGAGASSGEFVDGGGIHLIGRGQGEACSPTFRNLIVAGNYAKGNGGCLCFRATNNATVSPSLINVVFSGNAAQGHGAAYISATAEGTAKPTFVGVTFTGNRAQGKWVDGSGSGAVSCEGAGGTCEPTFTNTIFWHNQIPGGYQVNTNYARPIFKNCALEGGFEGALHINKGRVKQELGPPKDDGGNISADPLLVDPPAPRDAPTVRGNCRLRIGSPAIDAGDNGATAYASTDVSGKARQLGDGVDIGAYEQHYVLVKKDAGTGGDGSTWAMAYAAVEDAVLAAPEGAEIYVAAGKYQLAYSDKAVDIYGGFVGNETWRDQRDWSANETTLYNVHDVEASLDGITVERNHGGASFTINTAQSRHLIFRGDKTEPLLHNDPSDVAVTVDHIEVTQSVQNTTTDQSVPLVLGKDTAVRVYLTIDAAARLRHRTLRGLLKVERTKADGTATGVDDDIVFVWADNGLASTHANDDSLLDKRSKALRSLNFRIPEQFLAGTAPVPLKLSLARCVIETTEAAAVNAASAIPTGNSTTEVTVDQVVPPLRLRVVGLRYQNERGVRIGPRTTDYDHIKSWLHREFPSPAVDMSTIEVDAEQDLKLPLKSRVGDALMLVSAVKSLDMIHSTIDRRTRYYGLTLDPGARREDYGWEKTFMVGQAIDIPDLPHPATSAGPTGPNIRRYAGSRKRVRKDYWEHDQTFGDWYAAHELGHTLGLSHVNATGDEAGARSDWPYPGGKIGSTDTDNVGFDLGDETLDILPRARPWTTSRDMMSYGADQWVSDVAYKAMLERLQAEDALLADGSGSGGLVQWKEGSFINVVLMDRGAGNTSIAYVNPVAGGLVHQRTTNDIELRLHIDKPDGTSRIKNCSVFQRWNLINALVDPELGAGETLQKIEYVKSGTVLATYDVPDKPTHIVGLRVEDGLDGRTHRVRWAAGGKPHFNVQIERGHGWETIAVGLIHTQVEISIERFPDLSAVQVRIMATNGVETIYSDSVSLEATG